MKSAQRLWIHAAILVAAGAGAFYVWTRDTSIKTVAVDISVWGGKSADVQKIVFDTNARQTVLFGHTDDAGRWFDGTVTRKSKPEPGKLSEDGKTSADAERPTIIVSVNAAGRIADAIAPLRAVREIGIIEGDPAGDFGLAVPEATLTVTIDGVDRKLEIGTVAPGGTDRYVRSHDNNIIYAVRGDFARDLLASEAALNERDLHSFAKKEIVSARITIGNKTTEVRRSDEIALEDKWTNMDDDSPNEGIIAWMAKVSELRPTEYLATAPENATLVCRIEYIGEKGQIGFLELMRLVDGKDEYVLRTERTRKFAKAPSSVAVQLERDAPGEGF